MSKIQGILVILIIGIVAIAAQTSAEMELHGGSGGCSMCGSECKVLCASRQSRLFRSCCSNFMKKRADAEFEDFLSNSFA
ncbi:unnamed protein product [Allacma fusca]|uniref:Uncharacterized protein n=1 Tax=Allacma fusca TaxID=39272 RepID=A0A8J2KPT3_9HEXA|nr:unnamed protein product [Allacma fusca]